jgi:hypothetical protein
VTDNTTSNHRWSETWIERVEFAIAVLIQLSIFSIAVAGIIDRQWLTAFTGFVVLLLSFAPAVLERRLRVRLPVEVLLLTCLFLYASFALGEVRDFYERVWWWDLLLHGSSATIIGLIGFLAIYVFYMTHRIRIAPLYFAIFAFGTAVTVGTLWEVFEYLMDIAFGLNMQRSGLNDTMTDLMINLAGAFAAATVGFYYVRHSDGLLGRNLIRKLVQRYRTRHDTATPRSS